MTEDGIVAVIIMKTTTVLMTLTAANEERSSSDDEDEVALNASPSPSSSFVLAVITQTHSPLLFLPRMFTQGAQLLLQRLFSIASIVLPTTVKCRSIECDEDHTHTLTLSNALQTAYTGKSGSCNIERALFFGASFLPFVADTAADQCRR